MVNLQKRVRDLADKTIATHRYERSEALRDQLQKAKSAASGRGALGAGFYVAEQEKRCAQELLLRTDEWITTVERLVTKSGDSWSPALCRDVTELIRAALVDDMNDIVPLLRSALSAGSPIGVGHILETARCRSLDHLQHRLDEKLLEADRVGSPLNDQLADMRFAGIASTWRKALTHLEASPPDLANAAKDAITAVEGLAKLVAQVEKGTLGDAVTELRASGRVPQPLLRGLEDLWGYGNQSPNVRHGSATATSISSAEARFVVDSCEGALRYLLAVERAG